MRKIYEDCKIEEIMDLVWNYGIYADSGDMGDSFAAQSTLNSIESKLKEIFQYRKESE